MAPLLSKPGPLQRSEQLAERPSNGLFTNANSKKKKRPQRPLGGSEALYLPAPGLFMYLKKSELLSITITSPWFLKVAR